MPANLRLTSHITGILGRYYAARHFYGDYRSCAVSGVYYFPIHCAGKDFIGLLQYALAQTIDRHPSLCYGVIEKSEDDEAHLYQLERIKWGDVIELHGPVAEVKDETLCTEIGIGHQQLFEKQHERPAWKIVVLRYEDEPEARESRIDVLFFTHHAIADGGSCAAFHKTLLEHLQHGVILGERDRRVNWPYVVPEKISTPVFIEDVFPLTKYLQLPHVMPTTDPAFEPWTGNPPFMDSVESFKSRVLAVTIPLPQVSVILSHCRKQNITLTGLLHSLITLYLSKSVASADSFRACTPISMRRFTGTSDDEIVNHVSFTLHDWSLSLISSFRTSNEGSDEESSTIMALAKKFQDEVKEEILAIPERGPGGLLAMAGINDLDQFCQEGVKASKREVTYEISNVGLVTLSGGERGNTVRVERFLFSQSGMVAGSGIGCSVASIASGPLTACLHWQVGAVEDVLVEELRAYLERRLLAVV